MRILVGYFCWVLGIRIISVLLSFVALLILMDLIDNIEDVLKRRGNITDIFMFIGYRVPTIIESLLPLSVLIGSTLGLLTLASHSELIALRAAGISKMKMAALGIPACLIVALAHFVMADRIAPFSEKAFIEWWEPLKKHSSPQWISGDGSIVRIHEISKDGSILKDLTIFERDDSNRLVSQFRAGTAKFENSQWKLYDVKEIYSSNYGAGTRRPNLQVWSNGPEPQLILDLMTGPDQLSTGTLEKLLSVAWSSNAEPSVYNTELARRSAGPITSLVMMLIAAATVRGQNRSMGPQLGAALGLALGLTFLVMDGMFASLGKAGVLAPLIAAWAPILCFFGIVGLLFRFER